MLPLITWPESALLIGVVVLIALLSHGLLIFVIRRIVQRLTEHESFPAGTLGARAARVMVEASGMSLARQRQRTATLGSLLRSVVTLVIYSVMVLTILAILGVPMAPLLASAGVGGIALGFGAQALVKDFLAGLFLIAEDQYGVGDFIKVGDISGTVEEVTFRITKLRDPGGLAWYIRNGEVGNVGNISQGWSTGTVDIPVAYVEDAERVLAILQKVVIDLDADPTWSEQLLETPTVAGVESITGGTMTMRIFAKCAPNKQWGVQREIRERAKIALDEAGIKGPQVRIVEP